MMLSFRTRLAAILVTATVTVTGVALAGPGSAEVGNVFDGANSAPSLGDITTVRIDHRARNIVITTNLADLRRTSAGGPSGLVIWFDTDATRSGPEFLFTTGLQSGTDFQLLRSRDWAPVGAPLGCAHDAVFDWSGDRVVLTVARPCLGRPAQIRVAERMKDFFDGSHVVTDWLKGFRQFSRWVAHG